jgi:hypothetical protein
VRGRRDRKQETEDRSQESEYKHSVRLSPSGAKNDTQKTGTTMLPQAKNALYINPTASKMKNINDK